MTAILQPWQLLLLILAGWINRHQQEVLEYWRAGNQILRGKPGKKCILLNWVLLGARGQSHGQSRNTRISNFLPCSGSERTFLLPDLKGTLEHLTLFAIMRWLWSVPDLSYMPSGCRPCRTSSKSQPFCAHMARTWLSHVGSATGFAPTKQSTLK